ncbi:hypothetical protein DFJ74DRAFT_693693 [Hyaloraphidium curvatum]|nr:hypothetical protein DFJ74DRAFT_693693 [Hyaloraphidium curvatum]
MPKKSTAPGWVAMSGQRRPASGAQEGEERSAVTHAGSSGGEVIDTRDCEFRGDAERDSPSGDNLEHSSELWGWCCCDVPPVRPLYEGKPVGPNLGAPMTRASDEPAWVSALRSDASCAPLAGLLWPLLASHPGAIDFFGIVRAADVDAAVRCGPALRGFHVHGGAVGSVLLAASAALVPGRYCSKIDVKYGRPVDIGKWYHLRAKQLPGGGIASEIAVDGAARPCASADSLWAPFPGDLARTKGTADEPEPAALCALAASYPPTGIAGTLETTLGDMVRRGYFSVRDRTEDSPVPYMYGHGGGPPVCSRSHEHVTKEGTECWWRIDNAGGERGPGSVHPGILFSLMDHTVAWSGHATALGFTVTASISVSFLPASLAFNGGWVRVVASGEPVGTKRVAVRGTMEDAAGRVLATAEASFARLGGVKILAGAVRGGGISARVGPRMGNESLQ